MAERSAESDPLAGRGTRVGPKHAAKLVRKFSEPLLRFVQRHPEAFIIPPGLDRDYWASIEWLRHVTDLARLSQNKDVSAEVFALVLQGWLRGHAIVAPPGVFKLDLNTSGPGRPRNPIKDQALALFRDRPNWSLGQIAKQLLPDIFAEDQKRARDQIRSLIQSALKELGFPDEAYNLFQVERKRLTVENSSHRRTKRDIGY